MSENKQTTKATTICSKIYEERPMKPPTFDDYSLQYHKVIYGQKQKVALDEILKQEEPLSQK